MPVAGSDQYPRRQVLVEGYRDHLNVCASFFPNFAYTSLVLFLHFELVYAKGIKFVCKILWPLINSISAWQQYKSCHKILLFFRMASCFVFLQKLNYLVFCPTQKSSQSRKWAQDSDHLLSKRVKRVHGSKIPDQPTLAHWRLPISISAKLSFRAKLSP